jgi:hypothetical protein
MYTYVCIYYSNQCYLHSVNHELIPHISQPFKKPPAAGPAGVILCAWAERIMWKLLAQLNEQLALLFLLTIEPEESRESSLLIVHTINLYEMI